MHVKRICLLGGTGFVGRHILAGLGNCPIQIRVPTRHRPRHRGLLVVPNVDLMEANIYDDQALEKLIAGCDAVINLVGILNESRPDDFQRVHVELPRRLAAACKRQGVGRLLHMSALGAGPQAPSRYQQSKAEGERVVHEAADDNLAVTSFRPSVIFGPGDSFLNRFAHLLRLSPLVFPLPTPNARFQPVYVGDVARAFIESLEDRERFGQSYPLCGPHTYTLRELVEYVSRQAGVRRKIIGLPDGLTRLQARILGLLPGKPYSYDNYLSSTVDNVCERDGLAELGIVPTAIDEVAPGYLTDFRLRRRYNVFARNTRDQRL